MNWQRLEIETAEEALRMANSALEMPIDEFFKNTYLTGDRVREEYFISDTPEAMKFMFTPQLRLYYEFTREWKPFAFWKMEPQDFSDVLESARLLIAKILTRELSTKDPLAPEEIYQQELEKLPGYLEWKELAKKRFNELSKLDKYKAFGDVDPNGL